MNIFRQTQLIMYKGNIFQCCIPIIRFIELSGAIQDKNGTMVPYINLIFLNDWFYLNDHHKS